MQSHTSDTNENKYNKAQVPKIQHMVMRTANYEVRHCIIYTKFSNRFTNCSTILKIKGVRLHPLDITFFTECLKRTYTKLRAKPYIVIFKHDVKWINKEDDLGHMENSISSFTNSISSFGITSMSSSWPPSESSNIERLGLENLFFNSITSCSIN